MKNIIVACFLVYTTTLLTGCVTTDDPYDQPYNSGYTGYTVGMGPSYWGSGYSPNPGYDYGYGNTAMVYYGGTGYYRSGYYGHGGYGGYGGGYHGGYGGGHGGGHR